jgi:hypothetical protein
VVPRDHRELLRLGERAEEIRGALELAGLAGEREVAGDDEVIDADLLQGVEEPLRQARRVALAVTRREPVPRVTAAVRDVQIADVAEADDASSRAGVAPPRFEGTEGARTRDATDPLDRLSTRTAAPLAREIRPA